MLIPMFFMIIRSHVIIQVVEKHLLAAECKERLMKYLYIGSDWAIVIVMGHTQMHFERLSDGYKFLQTIVVFPE